MQNRLVGRRAGAAAFALAAAMLATPAIGATDITDIGAIDQTALATIPAFQSANRQLNDYGASLQKQYVGRAQHASPQEQQRLSQEFQGKMADKQRQLFGPLFAKAQTAVASVASSKNLSVVLDKRIVVYGPPGQDITQNVKDLLSGVGDPVPPVASPPPSKVGFVDQAAVDQTPKVKSATETFMKFKAERDKAAGEKLKGAKSNADRDAVLKEYRKTLDDEQAKDLKPLVDQTRGAIADVAKSKGLALVVDRGNVVFGGTDITSDVTSKLK